MVTVVVIFTLLVGFLTGLLTFRVKNRWCPQCGATTTALAGQQTRHPR